jgi:hypothetical protein
MVKHPLDEQHSHWSSSQARTTAGPATKRASPQQPPTTLSHIQLTTLATQLANNITPKSANTPQSPKDTERRIGVEEVYDFFDDICKIDNFRVYRPSPPVRTVKTAQPRQPSATVPPTPNQGLVQSCNKFMGDVEGFEEAVVKALNVKDADYERPAEVEYQVREESQSRAWRVHTTPLPLIQVCHRKFKFCTDEMHYERKYYRDIANVKRDLERHVNLVWQIITNVRRSRLAFCL